MTVHPSQYGIGGRAIESAPSETLAREYLECTKDSFGMFGGNAGRQGNAVVAELQRRGVTHIANVFGDIEIRPFTY